VHTPTADDAMPSRLNEMPTWLISQALLDGHRLLAQALAAMDSNGYQYRLLAAWRNSGRPSQQPGAVTFARSRVITSA